MINGKVFAEFCIPCFYFFMIYYVKRPLQVGVYSKHAIIEHLEQIKSVDLKK